MPEVLLLLSLREIFPFCKSLLPPPLGYTTVILSLLQKLNASFNQHSEPGGREMASASLSSAQMRGGGVSPRATQWLPALQ